MWSAIDAEGLNILRNADGGKRPRDSDAKTAPLRYPEYYRYELDLAETTEVWRCGSVVTSWFLDLTAAERVDDPGFTGFSGHVSDSGEGCWTALAAVGEGVPIPVISAAPFERFTSRDDGDYADRL